MLTFPLEVTDTVVVFADVKNTIPIPLQLQTARLSVLALKS
jgi:hypothetical protein